VTDPFAFLEIKPTNDVEAVLAAYHRLARKWHPDQFRDPAKQEEATRHMVLLNQAYQEALQLASSRANTPYNETISCEDTMILARKHLLHGRPQAALRQLLRADVRSSAWYALQGETLMAMEQFESAEQSYREAIRRDPNNMTYRAGALDALVAARRAKTLLGRVRHLLHNK
jgi:tetratricopeptide (TPR) repeat protein